MGNTCIYNSENFFNRLTCMLQKNKLKLIETSNNRYAIKNGESDVYIKTPGGNDLWSHEKIQVENIINGLQKFPQIEIDDEFNFISGSPSENVTLYSLKCKELDFEDSNKQIDLDRVVELLCKDPLVHVYDVSGEPEKSQFVGIDVLLSDREHDLKKLWSENDMKSEINSIANIIVTDIEKSERCEAVVFYQLLEEHESPILSWAFAFHALSARGYTMAITETKIAHLLHDGEFLIVDEWFVGELEKYRDHNDLNNQELWNQWVDTASDLLKPPENMVRARIFDECLNILECCSQFFQDNLIPELQREESERHEFKATILEPIELEQQSQGGETFYIMGNEGKHYKTKKAAREEIQKSALKAIVAFLNSEGGTLVIGVHERGGEKKHIGIQGDKAYKNDDKYKRDISELIKTHIGANFLNSHISISIKKSDGKAYCIIECKKFIPAGDETIAFLLPGNWNDREEMAYRRLTAGNQEITGTELNRFINARSRQSPLL